MNQLFRHKYLYVIVHIAVWVILFLMPLYLSPSQDFNIEMVIRRAWTPLFVCFIIFYSNYLYLIKKFLLNNKFQQFVLLNLLLILIFIGVNYGVNELMHNIEKNHFFRNEHMPKTPKFAFLFFGFISSVIPIVFAVALVMVENWTKEDNLIKETANAQLLSENQLLKYQLQPHFFFNSLNNVYSLIDLSPEQAKNTIHTLSKLMRYMLYESNGDKVLLSQEIDFLVKYIELMKMRSAENVNVNFTYPNDVGVVKIVPLLLISIVENAFKHGVFATENSPIDFELNVDSESISFKSQNKYFSKIKEDKSLSGIGFVNLKKRLELLYPGKYKFLNRVENNYYVVGLTIKF